MLTGIIQAMLAAQSVGRFLPEEVPFAFKPDRSVSIAAAQSFRHPHVSPDAEHVVCALVDSLKASTAAWSGAETIIE